MQNHNWIFLFLSFFVASTAQANSDYRCTIQRVSIADTEPNPTLKLYEKNYIGKQFSVERKSGIMTVNEYDESPKKPFVYLNNDIVFFSSCEHF